MNVCSLALIVQNPAAPCPPEIFDRQVAVPVRFHTFGRRQSGGFVVIDRELENDIRELFDLILRIRFPIASANPISFPPFFWNDDHSMAANNTSGFNYRTIAGTPRLSQHALGRAIDINPLLNPYVRGGVAKPDGAYYDPARRGTLTAASPVTLFLKRRGWVWGGSWKDPKDYQHFEKPLAQ